MFLSLEVWLEATWQLFIHADKSIILSMQHAMLASNVLHASWQIVHMHAVLPIFNIAEREKYDLPDVSVTKHL